MSEDYITLPEEGRRMEAKVLTGFTRSEVVYVFDRLGLEPPTKKQFYYWAQSGLIDVHMANAKEPLYSFQTILNLLIIRELLAGGVSLQKVRKALAFLAKEYDWGNLETKPCLKQYQLITDGEDIYQVRDNSDIMSILLKPRQLGWRAIVFPADKIVEESAAVIVSLPRWRERLRREELAAYSDAWAAATGA